MLQHHDNLIQELEGRRQQRIQGKGWSLWLGKQKVRSTLHEKILTHLYKPCILERWEKWGIKKDDDTKVDCDAVNTHTKSIEDMWHRQSDENLEETGDG